MDSATPAKTSNPKNVYHIGGIQVEFPFQPYGSQLAFMGRVIATLDRAQRDGHCHALLESPTGTGKSLSLLCSSLAWQKNYRSKNLYANLSHSKPAPEALSNPLAYGGGFVPETQPSTSGNAGQAPSGENSKNKKKKAAPTIFYASRTHSQISQVIREYRKTAYRVPMAILASRKNYCTSPYVRGKENIDEECKLLLKNKDVSCPEFKNMHKVKGHPSLQRGGCHEVHDIEDLVKVGQVVKGCSYYAARSMGDDAQLVFCPYSYIINPVIRGAMEVDIKGAILILDEAHNIEDMARDAGSVDLEEDVLEKLQIELQQLCLADALIYQPLYEMAQDIISWIQRRKDTLEKREFQTYCSCWTGDKALRELQEANITIQCFPILLECARKAIKVATDAESEVAHLSGMAVLTLEGLISSLSYFFSRNGLHVLDYQLALRRYVKRDAAGGGWTHTFSLWCLNPGVVFREIADLSLSVILTSGTLSPMNSFSSELGVQFGTCLEAPHVIDADSQLWAAVISTGLNNYPLNASYKTADCFDFQDALGKTLEEICKIVPGGALVFFPSYKLMDKLCYRWKETGQWSQLNARKSLFVEPRGGHQDDFDSLLKGYYNMIHRGSKSTIGRKRRGKKIDPNHLNAMDLQESYKKEGAAFLAVCRGKVSEGIDFSDESARVVIVVGIPFPNINDIQIAQKKKYNDTYKTSKNLLSGNEWYCHQAFRALNQAAGRCIRHRFDYGAIILLDERFQEERNTAYVSKWLRKSIRKYENFSMALEGLKSFYTDAKEKFGNKPATALEDSSDLKVGNIHLTDQTKGFTTKKNQPNPWGQKSLSNTGRTSRLSKPLTSMTNYYSSVSKKLGSPVKVEIQSSELTSEKDISGCRESTILECSPHKDLRCSRDISIVDDCAEVSIIKETPADINLASPVSFCKDENSSSTIIQTSLNLSVNSHTQKRRKSMCSPLVNLVQAEHPDALGLKTPGNINYTENLNRRIEFDMETNCSELPAGPVLDKKLKLLCLKCRNPLGLPENELYVTCSLTSSTKVHLASLLKGRWEPLLANTLTSIPVVISDILSVNPKLCMKAAVEDARGEGVWCEKDGCVFNTIFCPFCTEPKNCLGVQIMATDASNVQLLNKILFYFDRLEIKNAEVANESVSSSQVGSHSSHNVKAVLNPFDKFACKSPMSSGGWRTTRSKMRLPKRALIADSDDQCGTQTRPHVVDI